MRIGQLENLTQISRSRIRFYERQNLLPPPARRANGYRSYDTETVDILKFIDQAQQLGFSLAEIRASRPSLPSAAPSTAVIKAALHQKDIELERLMEQITQWRKTIKELLLQLECVE